MSPLTKAFVVLVTVLSIVLVALVVPFVAKTQNYQGEINNLKTQAAQAKQAARIRQDDVSALQENLSEQQAQYTTSIATLTATVRQLQADLNLARDQVKQESAGKASLESAFHGLSAAQVQIAALLETLNKELKSNRNELVNLRTKVIELTDKNNEQASLLLSYDRQVRRLREEETGLQEHIEELEQQISLLPPELRTPSGQFQVHRSLIPITGQVTAVDSSTETTLLEVNVGHKDGVTEGMDFMVYRGEDHYLGKLLIQSVDTAASAGRITLSVNEMIRAGDAVYAGPP